MMKAVQKFYRKSDANLDKKMKHFFQAFVFFLYKTCKVRFLILLTKKNQNSNGKKSSDYLAAI